MAMPSQSVLACCLVAALLDASSLTTDWYTGPVWIDAGQGGDDIIGCVRDQRRVMIAAYRAIRKHEIEQVRHLLKIRRNIRIVAPQMHVIKLNLYHMLDPVAEIAGGRR